MPDFLSSFRKIRTSLILVLIFAVLASRSKAWAQSGGNVVGTITETSGTVQLDRGAYRSNVVAGEPLELHDKLTTGPGNMATVTLNDKSKLAIGESTTIVIDESVVSGGVRASSKISLLFGSLRSAVSQVARGSTPSFEIHTPNAIAGVRGTIFDVRFANNTTRSTYPGITLFSDVAVVEGEVDVSNPLNPAGGSIDLFAGESTTVAGNLPPGKKTKSDSSDSGSGGGGFGGINLFSNPPVLGAAPPPASGSTAGPVVVPPLPPQPPSLR